MNLRNSWSDSLCSMLTQLSNQDDPSITPGQPQLQTEMTPAKSHDEPRFKPT